MSAPGRYQQARFQNWMESIRLRTAGFNAYASRLLSLQRTEDDSAVLVLALFGLSMSRMKTPPFADQNMLG